MAQTEGLKESLKEPKEKLIISNIDNFSLSEKVSSLEEQLQSKDNDPTSSAQVKDLERINEELEDKLFKTEARAKEAEFKCKTREETQNELKNEFGTFKAKGFTTEKLISLEKHLRDSDLQLEHVVAAVEASKEKQKLLYSIVSDMENVIEDLKSKVLKAENKADYTEDKLITVSESNVDLNKELSFFRCRLKEVEKALQQAEERELNTTKDISLHNYKIIKKLLMQLAAERQRLHQQVSKQNPFVMFHILSPSSIVRLAFTLHTKKS